MTGKDSITELFLSPVRFVHISEDAAWRWDENFLDLLGTDRCVAHDPSRTPAP
jgi:hypothetical protein